MCMEGQVNRTHYNVIGQPVGVQDYYSEGEMKRWCKHAGGHVLC